jgi:hypothetical protein
MVGGRPEAQKVQETAAVHPHDDEAHAALFR